MSALLNALKKAAAEKKQREVESQKQHKYEEATARPAENLSQPSQSIALSDAEEQKPLTFSLTFETVGESCDTDKSIEMPTDRLDRNVDVGPSSFSLSMPSAEDRLETKAQPKFFDVLAERETQPAIDFELAQPEESIAIKDTIFKQDVEPLDLQPVTQLPESLDFKLSSVEPERQSTYQPKLKDLDVLMEVTLDTEKKTTELEADVEPPVDYVPSKPKLSKSEKNKASGINRALLVNNKSLSPTRPGGHQIVKRLSFYLLGMFLMFVVMAYYGLSSYQRLEAEYERDIEYLLNIVNQAERDVEENSQVSVQRLVDEQVKPVVKDVHAETGSVDATTEVKPVEHKVETHAPLTENLHKIAQKQPEAPHAIVKQPPSRVQVERAVQKSFAELAYEAYKAGDLQGAEASYKRHLALHPQSKTSRLGLAAIAVERGEFTLAIDYYQQVLRSDPDDIDALSGMASTASSLTSSFYTIEDLKRLVNRHPTASALHFALGNLYAKQQDWFLAQPVYFEAVRLDSQNPDYRLNLAITLDQLGEHSEAIVHYKMALALAQSNKSNIEGHAVNQRIIDLERFLERR